MANHLKQNLGRYLFLVLAVALLVASVGVYLALRQRSDSGSGAQTIPIEGGASSQAAGPVEATEGKSGMSLRLSEGQEQAQTAVQLPVATGEPLSPEEIEAVLSRLPDLTQQAEDQVDFRLAQDPIPPPRAGETIEETFPPPPDAGQPEAVETGPLQVLRFAPEGEIPLAPFVNVTFNQPMVPLGTLEALAAEDVPVRIEPALPGTWRWLGTKTLTFEYDSDLIDRLPKATEYHLSVPAGTRSATGGVLAETVSWTFTTPPPKAITTYPSGEPQPLEPLFFLAFDQRINPQAVLETIRVDAGGQEVSLEMAGEDAIQADARVSRMVKNAGEGRWLAFKAVEPLPADTSVTVDIGPGTPSAEGPLVTTQAQSYYFQTYAPLAVVEHGCSWSDDTCRPLTPFYIRFNNPIDRDFYDESMLSIEPELPGASVNIFGNSLQIQGASKGQTTYTLIVNGDIQDVFGQKLGRDTRLTIKVGPAESLLFGPEQTFVSLDPASDEATFSVYTINYNSLDVEVYAVQPSDWLLFKQYLRDFQRSDNPVQIPGRLVRDDSVRVEAAADTLTEVGIDLGPEMDGDYGQFIIKVQPSRRLFQNNRDAYRQTVHAWVQITQIGLDAFVDHSQMVVWATDLKDGAPLAGVRIEAGQSGFETRTGPDGTASFEVPGDVAYLVARDGADLALLPGSLYFWDDQAWRPRPVRDELRWYVFDDREMYRPGEEIHVKGWLRRIGGGQNGDVGLAGEAVSSVSFQITGPQGNELGNGEAEVNALGGFDFTYTLPEETNLGYAQIYLQAYGGLGNLDNTQYYHSFQIQEFRRPEFEVTARLETPGPFFVGEGASVAVEAGYYAGGPLPNADVTWQVSASPGNYSPPNWPDFTFGTWEPWWWYDFSYEDEYYGSIEGGSVETFSGKTDATGTHYLNLDFDEFPEPRPYSLRAEATVFDVNRQAWADSANLLVHPAEVYVGMRSDRYFVEQGQPLQIDLIVTDLDGTPIIDRQVLVRSARLEWKYTQGRWGEEEVDIQECRAGSEQEPVSCSFETTLGGRYRITASTTDVQGRTNQSQLTRWVSGGQQPPARNVERESVTLIPDKETYQPGDVASILVQSPFSPAEGLLTISRSGIIDTRRFQIQDGSTTLEVAIEDGYIPNLWLQVDLVGAAPRSDDQGETLDQAPPRPAYASGQLNLKVPPLSRSLSLQVTPQASELEPGGETTLDILLEDAEGHPQPGAELAVVIVDEAILALSDYQLADPLDIFYAERYADFSSTYARSSIVLADPQALAQAAGEARVSLDVVEEAAMEAPAAMPTQGLGLEDGQAKAMQEPIQVRSDFNPLAVFAPNVRTDDRGAAQVAVKLPDNLTRYRIMVVAVDSSGRRFGAGESNLTARLPLMVRPSAPRFLNFGDRFELPVVLQNQTDEEMQVEVVIRASNLELSGSAGLRVSVPARDRIEVRFPATTQLAGTARLQIAATSGAYADAAALELPVYTPATSEAFATYGVVDEGALIQPVAAPENVFPQYGGLEINTSSTALQALTDAVLYLVSYPYECSEQIASRILAVAALRDVLEAFEAEGLPTPDEMQASVQRDITLLAGMQNDDGGFPYWRRNRDSIPFNSIHVAYALQQAIAMGFEVPPEMQARLMEHLRQIENYYPAWYDKSTRWTMSAYALFVRDKFGEQDAPKALALIEEAGLENLSMEAMGWLWPVLQDASGSEDTLEAIRRLVNNRVVETAGAANFTTTYYDQTYLLLSSDRRTDAILLDAMIVDAPQHDLIPKLVNGLLAHRKQGRWSNTQENVFILLALKRYFNTYEAETPDFVARIWLGEAYAGDHEYRGRTTERHETLIPMNYLMDGEAQTGGTQDLILSKEGAGRLYFRLGLRYAPTDLDLEPLDMGFVVQRIYEGVDDPGDVWQDEEGIWHVRAGARVRVRLKMVADNRRYHVALVDPLPAGLEIVNPALEVSGSIPQDPSSPNYRYGWWWWGSWYEHQNMRDERAEAFTSLLWEGVYEYTYVARATTPGRFVVPPSRAEEMYSPEVFGRSGSDVVIVESGE